MRIPHVAKVLALGIAIVLGASGQKSFAISSPILLTIDDSNPSAVKITATGFAPAVNNGTIPVSSGVDLLGFFTENQFFLFGDLLPGSTLIGGASGVAYNDIRADNFSTGGGPNSFDLRLSVDASSPSAGNLQGFSTAQPAFTGTWVLDLNDLGSGTSGLPTNGATGDILTGFYGNQGAIIGQWEVANVPEPGIGSLFILSSAVALAVKRRK